MSIRSTLSTTVLVAGLIAAPGLTLAAETAVTLPNGVVGTLNSPDAGGTGAAVVLLHGFGSNRDEIGGIFIQQAAALAEAGITSLRIDFRGQGESAGEAVDTTIEAMIEDSAAAREHLLALEGIDPDRVGVLGYSFGAAVALLEADQYDAVALWGQMGDLEGEFRDFLGDDIFAKAAAEGKVDLDLGWRQISLGSGFFESLGRHSLADAFAGYQGPFLTLAGADDPATGYFDQFLDLAAGEKSSVTIPGTDHMFGVYSNQPEIAADVVAQTTAWFATNL